MSESVSPAPSALARLKDGLLAISVNRKLAYALAAAAAISGIATVATMTDPERTQSGVQTVIVLLYLDLALLLLLGFVVARRVVAVWVERRRGAAGAGLHSRLVLLFSAVAITPAILVAVFSTIFLNFGIQGWFGERVSTALSTSVAVTEAYLAEHRKNIHADAFAITSDLNRLAPQLSRSPWQFNRVLSSVAGARGLTEAAVVDSAGKIIARSDLSFTDELEPIPPESTDPKNRGRIIIVGSERDDRIRAVVRLDRFVDAYLIVERFVDPRVKQHISEIRGAVDEYRALEKERSGIEVSFAMIYAVAALLLLLAAGWIGLTVSTQIARPITDLISAAERVRGGDLTAQVPEPESSDEISGLSRAFNAMTGQISTQQQGLIDANRELDERRRFTETVLAGVTAGVIGLDVDRRIHLPNRSASDLLGLDLAGHTGEDLAEVVPEMAGLLEMARLRPERLHQDEIRLPRGGQYLTLLVRIAAEQVADDVIGYVVTFDDVTALLSAQRKAAWADVARRIAHEIKNPLTPIQLSAERLKRKYQDEIASDPETFAQCTETIIRQVEDIGRMVDEFSSFARMPEAAIKPENLSELCRQAVYLEQERSPGITFETALPADDQMLHCDRRQISRALTNLLKNATESIGSDDADRPRPDEPGRVRLSVEASAEEEGAASVVIEDNGVGLPTEGRDRLTEPYVTTRTKGTGLGLAIVRKIMEDHQGDLLLEDRPGGGARITLAFRPRDENEDGDAALDATAASGGTG